MLYAIYKEDLLYQNCPIYWLNNQTDCYDMNGQSDIYFKREEVEQEEFFLLFQTLEEAQEVKNKWKQTKINC